MENINSYVNKDHYGQSYEQFCSSTKNDFIDDNFIAELEWAMLITQGRMKQTHYIEGQSNVTISQFDKCHLWGRSNDALIDDDKYGFLPIISEYQASPDIFPLINSRILTIGKDYIALDKVKELPPEKKRNLIYDKRYKHVYEHTIAIYDKDKESFYGRSEGYGVHPSLFNLNDGIKDVSLWKNIVYPISLINGAFYNDKELEAYALRNIDWYKEWYIKAIYRMLFSYQIALTDYYNWMIYIKEYDNIGFIIPIDPIILSEIYKTSMIKFESRKAMLHFVRDHYRRRLKDKDEDYSIYVRRYLRGETKFDYRGFYAEIIPPRYDLNRVHTRKKFIDTTGE